MKLLFIDKMFHIIKVIYVVKVFLNPWNIAFIKLLFSVRESVRFMFICGTSSVISLDSSGVKVRKILIMSWYDLKFSKKVKGFACRQKC